MESAEKRSNSRIIFRYSPVEKKIKLFLDDSSKPEKIKLFSDDSSKPKDSSTLMEMDPIESLSQKISLYSGETLPKDSFTKALQEYCSFQMESAEKRSNRHILLYSFDSSKPMRLFTSFNVKKETIHNWRDYLRLHCYPPDKYSPGWPPNPSSFKPGGCFNGCKKYVAKATHMFPGFGCIVNEPGCCKPLARVNWLDDILRFEKFLIKDFPSLLEYWSNSRDFNSKILPSILFFVSLFGAGHAQTPDLTREGYLTSKNISHKHDELPPRTSRVEKNWIQGIDGTNIIMFIGIMLLVLVVYCYKESLSAAFCILWTYITHLMQTLKRTMKQTWIKLKKNSIEHLRAVFQLSNIALASPFLGGAHKWKASVVAGIAVFALICYCAKVSVELKRAEVTATFFYPETRNNKKVFFFTARHVLEFLVPLSYALLACVYLTELDAKNHRTENDWKSVAFIILVFIHVIGGFLAFMNARNPYYFRHGDQNQMVPMQPIDTIPRKGNEIILKDKPVVAEELSEVVADMNV